MAQLIEIKNRIKSVESTLKITKAMKITAAARLIKAKDRVNKVTLIKNKLDEIINRIDFYKLIENNIITKLNNKENDLYVIFTSDRGFCGGFNFKLLHYSILKNNNKIQFAPIGEKGIDFFDKTKNIKIFSKKIKNIWENNILDQSYLLYNELKSLYLSGLYRKIYLIYNEFVSILKQIPVKKQLFPLIFVKKTNENNQYLFEPNKQDIIETILPFVLNLKIFTALIETKAGEYSSRMTSMEGANINGEKLIRKLKIQFQRARQESITKELSELIGGVECQKMK